MPKNFPLCIFLLFIVEYVQAENTTTKIVPGTHARLFKTLFTDYDKRIRPFADEGVPVVVNGVILGAILIQVEENKQVASYVASRNPRWFDPRLAWDPKNYSGIQSITVPTETIWLPDTFVYNSLEYANLLSEQKDYVRIHHTGECSINIPLYLQATCRIIVHRFPFDTQYCSIDLSSNQMISGEMIWRPVPVKFNRNRFVGNSEWSIENVTMAHKKRHEVGVWGNEGVISFKFVFQIKRRSTYYVTVIVIPTFLITAVSIVGVFAPGTEHSAGDVAGLGLATLLALMVLLGIISDMLPKSEEMPLLGWHILIILVVFVICVLFEMASLFMFKKRSESGDRPPQWLYTVSFLPMKKETSSKFNKYKLDYQNSSVLENGHSLNGNSLNGNSLNGIHVDLDRRSSNSTTLTDSTLSLKKQDGMKNGKKRLIKRVFSKDNVKENIDLWRHIVHEMNLKKEDEKKERKIEWDLIETRLDFIWIFIFEALNLCNLLSLIYFANLPTPDINDWLNVH